MDIKDIKETNIWLLYEKAKNYARQMGIYDDSDKNYRMYNGDQWNGLIIQGVEPVSLNFIRPIVKYKTGTIAQNLWAINYAAENYDNPTFQDTARAACELLNKRAAKIWDLDQMDYKVRQIAKQSAINDEGVVYVDYDQDKQMPVNEVISKTDVYYGNENDSDIQKQPYIIIKQRMPVSEAQEMAKVEGVSEDKLNLIIGDMDFNEESGADAKYEVDDMTLVLTKLYKKRVETKGGSKDTVYFSKSTRYVDIAEDKDSGLSLYPVEHFVWEEKEGSARGEGEVRHLIPNQLEVNKTIMRRLIAAKQTAYPQRIVNTDMVVNPQSLDSIGGIIKVSGGVAVDDVRKYYAHTQPAQMSSDVEKVQNELISLSRDLAGAGDTAAGDVNPESASGRAILAVQQASQLPLSEQTTGIKRFLEGLARIWLDMIKTYASDGLVIEDKQKDMMTGEEISQMVTVPESVLQELQASVKVDITPKGAFDKYAQELSLENLLKNGMISLEEYVDSLDDDSVMPKAKLEEIVKKRKEAQEKIAAINNQAQLMQQQVNQFIGDPEMQQQYQAEQAPQGAPMNGGVTVGN